MLKTATAGHHADAEEAFSGFDLSSRDDYRAFLSAQAAAVLPLERWITDGAVAAVLPDWPARRRGHLLVDDLAALGAAEPAWGAACLPGDVLGAVYVLEGSRFGGRLLARRTSETATRYLRDPGAPGSWRGLWQVIDSEVSSGRRNIPAIVEAAVAAFALFRHGAVQGLRQLAFCRSPAKG